LFGTERKPSESKALLTCSSNLKVRKQRLAFFPTMYEGRKALPDDHKFRGQRGRVRARYRRPQLGRGSEKIGETSQRKTNLQLASGAFSCKVAPFTPAGQRTKKAPSRGGRTGSNGQQHPVVIDCEVLQKRRSRCTTPGELRASRTKLRLRRHTGRKSARRRRPPTSNPTPFHGSWLGHYDGLAPHRIRR
jgi:hypothetical protein